MDHDAGYKRLFSHPEMVRDLLVGFVREPWVAEVDLATLERYPTELAAWSTKPELAELRHSFLVWLREAFFGTRLPGIEFSELNDLAEVRIMLSGWSIGRSSGSRKAVRKAVRKETWPS